VPCREGIFGFWAKKKDVLTHIPNKINGKKL
jgi:hypothetical protein